MKTKALENERNEQSQCSNLWKITNSTSNDLFFSLEDVLWDYDINGKNFFVIKDILDKEQRINKRKLGITIIRSEEKLIETLVLDIDDEEYSQFNKWKWITLNLTDEVLGKMPLISKNRDIKSENKKSWDTECKINPTNLEFLNLWNKAIIQGKILDFSIVEYFISDKKEKKPRIGILSLKTKEKRIISVHVEIFSLGQEIIKKLENQEGKDVTINTIVGKYRIQNIDINSVSDNDILLPHLYDIQEKEQKYHDKLLQLQVDIDHCHADIEEWNGDIEELQERLKELKEKDKKYTTIKVLYLEKG